MSRFEVLWSRLTLIVNALGLVAAWAILEQLLPTVWALAVMAAILGGLAVGVLILVPHLVRRSARPGG